MKFWTTAIFYFYSPEGYRYVIETCVVGNPDNVTIKYEELDTDTGEYVQKDLKTFTLPYDDHRNLFLEILQKAKDFSHWAKKFDDIL